MTIEYPDDEPLGPIAPPRPPAAPVVPASPLGGTFHVPSPSGCHTALALAGVALISFALAIGLTAWWLGGRGDTPRPSVDAVTLGRSFAPILAGTLADGFDKGRPLLKVGDGLGPADAALKAEFDRGRKAAFDRHAGAAIHAIVGDGAKVETPEQLRQIQDLFDGFAKGLRGAK
jgi:hypothetical protein